MKNLITKTLCTCIVWVALFTANGQNKGSLFIIGGGERPAAMMAKLIETADLHSKDYIVILPMATSIPAETISLISKQFSDYCTNKIASFNFMREDADSRQDWIDSVRNARLIYITGGDQNKFMDVVRDTRLYTAMHDAFRNGATISGTSAGAAVMSELMITGAERDSTDRSDFREIKHDNVILSSGMGFVKNAIIDQHFIRRARYNRLLTVLGDHPGKVAIGIDESTAIIVQGNQVTVTGDSQVVVISGPENVNPGKGNKIGFKNARLSLLNHGDTFELK